MGREIKRVLLDFDWPLKQVWSGYINPHYRDCPQCKAGYSKTYETLAGHLNSLVWDRMVQSDPLYAQVTEFLCGQSGVNRLFGHDSLDAVAAVLKLGQLAGLPEDWHLCDYCHGHGIDPKMYDAYEAWEPTEPPEGDGWQLWETVSEGSPVSPVLPTREAFVDWLINEGHTREAAEAFTRDGWAPSLVMAGGVIMSGVDAASLFLPSDDTE
jgi:hypothetical protein